MKHERLVIHSINPASEAAGLDLEQMDEVWRVNHRRFKNLDALIEYVQSRPNEPLRVVFRRASYEWETWHDYLVRELPNENVKVIPPPVSAATASTD